MKKNKFQYIAAMLILISSVLQAQGIEITSGGSIAVTGAATIEINNGDFKNNGTYSNGTEQVSMTGNSAKTMSGNGSTNMYNLYLSNSGGITHKMSQLNLHNLTLYLGSQLIIDTTSAINVSNVVRNKATVNDLIIKCHQNAANGSLIYHNVQDSALSATVEMYSKAAAATYSNGRYSNYKWQFFGVPLQSVATNPIFTGSYLRKFEESGTTSSTHWVTQGNSAVLSPFSGYEITQANATTIYFQGQLVNNNFSERLSYTSNAQYPGQHLIGNSYAAAIDITKVQFGSTRAGVIENTVYLYNTGSYSDWTTAGSGLSSGSSAGQYIGIPIHLAGINGLPAQIPSMQAFLVSATSNNDSATVSIPYSSVGTIVKNTDRQRIKSSESIISTRIDVAGTSYSDRMWIITNSDCTRGFDNGWDANKFLGSSFAPQLWAMESDGDYQVDAVNDINNTNLGFIAGEDTEYTLTFSHDNTSVQYPALYLLDLAQNTITDITTSGTTYSFTANGSDDTNRFKIVTSQGITTNTSNLANKTLSIYSSQQTIFIQNQGNSVGEIVINDITGRVISSAKFSANGLTTLKTNLTPGSYLVRGTTSNEKLRKRIIIN